MTFGILVVALLLFTAPRVDAQEIDVSSGGVSIVCGDTTPTRADGTDFGSVLASGESREINYLIKNTGSSDLDISSGVQVTGPHAADFSVTQPSATVLGTGTSSSGREPQTPFSITFRPSAPGVRSATVSIPNNDADEDPFTFDIQGYGDDGLTPDLHVVGNGADVFHGDETPSASNATDFEEVGVGSGGEAVVYTLRNAGGSLLTLGVVSVIGDAGFSVTSAPVADVPAGEAAALEITFDPGQPGESSARVSIASDDPDEAPYEFSIHGEGTAPEIEIRYEGVTIGSGDSDPSEADGTDFGATSVDGGTVERTFWIHNLGSGDLSLSGEPLVGVTGDAADFTVAQPSAANLRAGQQISFTMTFDPTMMGLRSATITIENNDQNEAPTTFAIQGTAGPDIRVQGNGVTILDGSNAPSVQDHTSFGSTPVGGESLRRTFEIGNLGPETLRMEGDRVTVSGPHASDFRVSNAPDEDVAADGGTTSFEITFTPGGAGLRTARIEIDSNDPDEDPYDFAVEGTGLVPEMVVSGNGRPISHTDASPETADGTDFGAVDIRDGTTSTSFTIRNDGGAGLELDGDPRVAITGANASDFHVVTIPASACTPNGGETTFEIQFDPAEIGPRTATVSIDNNDPERDPYLFDIQGTGSAVPEIEIRGNGQPIESGASTPATGDGTDFGRVGASNGEIARTFEVRNHGSGQLTMANAPFHVTIDDPAFAVRRQPDGTIPSDGGSLFEIVFDPPLAQEYAATVTVHSDDQDEAAYTFRIRGEGLSHAVVGGGSGNLAPIPNAGPDVVAAPGERVVLDGSMSYDPDLDGSSLDPAGERSDGLSFEWSFTVRFVAFGQPVYWVPEGSCAAATFADFDTASASFVPDLPGEYRLSLTVTDDAGSSTSDQVIVLVLPAQDQPPDSAEPFRFLGVKAYPNPFVGTVHFEVVGDGIPDHLAIHVYDLSGVLIWTDERDEAIRLSWDGRDLEGGTVPHGPYITICTVIHGTEAHVRRGLLISDP